MSNIGIVSIFIGALIVFSRAPLLIAPAAALRWVSQAIKTEARTRMLGIFAVLIGSLMMWAGMNLQIGLEIIIFIFGVLIVMVSVPALLLFPNAYMSVASSMLPADADTSFFGWRILGLVSIVIGVALIRAGMVAL